MSESPTSSSRETKRGLLESGSSGSKISDDVDISPFYIDINDYERVRKIDNGAYSTVYLVRCKKTGILAAQKRVKTDTREWNPIWYRREVGILGTLRHPALLSLVGCTPYDTDESHVFILTEYASRGSVDGMVKKEHDSQCDPEWTDNEKHLVLYGTACGMAYMHKNRVIHRDLKPANVLLDDNLEPKIADFGLSKYVNPGETLQQTGTVGTPMYMAPEIFGEDGKFGWPADVYAFGMMAYVVLSGCYPFPECTKGFSFQLKISNGDRPIIPESITNDYRCLIESCWSQDPESRPSFEAIVSKLEDIAFDEFHDKRFMAYQEKIKEFERENADALLGTASLNSSCGGQVGRTFSLDISQFYVDISDYEKVKTGGCTKLSGRGSLRKVVLVKCKKTGALVARKQLDVRILLRDPAMYEREVTFLGTLQHPAILSLIGCTPYHDDDDYAFIFTPYASHGSVDAMVEKEQGDQCDPDWTDNEKHLVLYGTACGMAYLHKNRIVHRDLKPSHVLLDDKLEPKISGFGLSNYVDSEEIFEQAGTPLYMAPEVLSGEGKIGFPADVYAFGMTAYAILSGSHPFPRSYAMDKHEKILSGERPEIPSRISDAYRGLIESCWAQEPESRPSFETILSQLEDKIFNEFHDERFVSYQKKLKEFETKGILTSGNSSLNGSCFGKPTTPGDERSCREGSMEDISSTCEGNSCSLSAAVACKLISSIQPHEDQSAESDSNRPMWYGRPLAGGSSLGWIFRINFDKIGDYELVGSRIEILGGYLQTVKHKESQCKYLLKTMPRSNPTSEAGYSHELNLSENVHCSTLAIVSSFFMDKDNFYVVYEHPRGEHLSAAVDEVSAKSLCMQFMHMLNTLHDQGVLYLRPVADNCWVSKDGLLTVVGLDFGQSKFSGEPSISKFAQWDGTAEEVTDLLSLGCFIHKALHGSDDLFRGDSREPHAKEPAKRVVETCCGIQSARRAVDPRTLFIPTDKVSSNGKKIYVNEYHVSWADGIAVGTGEIEVGFSDKKLYMSQGDGRLNFDARGVAMTDPQYGRELTLNQDGLSLSGEGITMTLGESGLKCHAGSCGDFDIDATGVHYRKRGKHLDITPNGIDFDFDAEEVHKTISPNYLELRVGKMVKIRADMYGFSIGCGKALVLIWREHFILGCGGVISRVLRNQFELLWGAMRIVLNYMAMINFGNGDCVVDEGRIDFRAEGFAFVGCGFSASIDNGRGQIDLASRKCTIPPINMRLPIIPKVPSLLFPVMPGISEPPSRKKKAKIGKNCGRAENFVNKGETIVRRARLEKSKLLSRTNIVAIFTSAKRTLFLNERFTKEVDDDLEIVKGARITIPKDRLIEVVDRRGKKRQLKFIDYSDFRLFLQEYKELASAD